MSEVIRDRLRAGLTAAMKDRDALAANAYRAGIAALDEAEAVPAPGPAPVVASSPHLAGATRGVGATEVPRRDLDESEQRSVVAAEAVSRRRAGDDRAGEGDQAGALRLWAEADLLIAVLA